MRSPLASGMRGFSMVEIVVVIAIVGLLAGIAIPSYRNYILRAHRSEAIRVITSYRQALERCYSQNFTYVNVAGNCPAAAGAAINTPNNYYNITFPLLNATQYRIVATAINTQTNDAPCATFTVDNAGAQTAATAGGADTTPTCWGAR
jgi:type IV pilus assembly protein PilE